MRELLLETQSLLAGREYAIYCDGRVVALVCDDNLFIKPTTAGRELIGRINEAPPYKGAKPYFFIPGEQWEDRDWLGELVRVSAADLPLPEKKMKPSVGDSTTKKRKASLLKS